MAGNECFGPVAPIFRVDDLDDALALANSSPYGLKEPKVGTVNVNEIPGFRLELSPFGGVKDSVPGIKEGVIDAMKFMSRVKTFSLPW